MKQFLVLLVLAFLLPVSALAKYVAVLETTADPAAKEIVSRSDRIYLTDVLRGEAVKVLPAEQNFTIMTRENINVMLPPGKTIEDCEGSCLAETGRNIAADYVAQARVGMFGGALTLNVEVYETAGNKLVASFNGDGESIKDLLAIIKRDSPDFFRKLKGGNGFGDFSGIGAVSGAAGFSFAASKKFIVEIVTEPAGALPTVDGKGMPKCTSTPCKVQLEAGEHRFVASKDRYDDAEMVARVDSNNQRIFLTLSPNYGFFNLVPIIGLQSSRLVAQVDGKRVKVGQLELETGVHHVKLYHPCYDPMEFDVAIAKGGSESFSSPMVRGVGGLELDAEWQGEPVAVPVYVDGVEVGSTPFAGKVPMCARVSVGNSGREEEVGVNLKWHEVVKYIHRLNRDPQAVVAVQNEMAESEQIGAGQGVEWNAEGSYAELDGKTFGTSEGVTSESEVGESIPTNIESEEYKIHWLPVGISAAVAVTGTVLAIVGNSNAKSAHDKDPANESEYRKNKDDIHCAQTLRAVGLVTAVVGAVVGLSFAF